MSEQSVTVSVELPYLRVTKPNLDRIEPQTISSYAELHRIVRIQDVFHGNGTEVTLEHGSALYIPGFSAREVVSIIAQCGSETKGA